MPSTPVLVLIALTVLACAFIVALLLKIRSQHIAAQPVFGSYGGIDRASNPMWRNRHVIDDDQQIVAGTYAPESKANEQDQVSSQAAAQYVEQQRARKQSGVSPDELKRFNEARNSNLK